MQFTQLLWTLIYEIDRLIIDLPDFRFMFWVVHWNRWYARITTAVFPCCDASVFILLCNVNRFIESVHNTTVKPDTNCLIWTSEIVTLSVWNPFFSTGWQWVALELNSPPASDLRWPPAVPRPRAVRPPAESAYETATRHLGWRKTTFVPWGRSVTLKMVRDGSLFRGLSQ